MTRLLVVGALVFGALIGLYLGLLVFFWYDGWRARGGEWSPWLVNAPERRLAGVTALAALCVVAWVLPW